MPTTTSASSSVSPGRPTRAGAAVSPVSRTSSSSISSVTRLETVPRVRPVSVATSAREHEPAGDVAEDDAEVGAPDRRLVGGQRGTAVERHRAVGGEGVRAATSTLLFGSRTN